MFKIPVYRVLGFLVISSLLAPNSLLASSITLILKTAPSSVQKTVKKTLEKEGVIKEEALKNAKRKASTSTSPGGNGFQRILPKISGFTTIYGGYVDYTDDDGVAKFPLRHKDPKIYLVITPEISLTKVFGNTISHKNFVDKVDAEIYLLEKKKNDAADTFYWKVTKDKKPTNNQISPLSVVLLTDPKNIVVPTGDFMTSKSPNLVLPDMYVVGNACNSEAESKFMDIKRHFEQIKREKIFDDSTKKEMVTNG